jgi:hypothetical protein
MRLHASGEDYLEAVLMLQQKYGMARSVDLARHMGRDGGFLTVDQDGFLHLTGAGLEAAEKIYERHQSVEQTMMAARERLPLLPLFWLKNPAEIEMIPCWKLIGIRIFLLRQQLIRHGRRHEKGDPTKSG